MSISRKATGINHEKLNELIHTDFSEFDTVAEQIKGYDACFACMGVSSAGMKEERYTRLTYTYTLALAKELFNLSPALTFTYVSGVGTDSSEKGRSMWARVKGKTENDLLNLGFKQAFMFRPGAIIPLRDIQPSSKFYRILINNLKWLLRLLKKLAPDKVVDTTQVGLAMINITKKGYDKLVIHPHDIQILAE